jgi:hypothetical protein
MNAPSLIKISQHTSPPLAGGEKGRGKIYVHPHPNPLPSRERGKILGALG